ncbi:MAG: hypothetical protein AB7Q42_05760 [Acidimicrobiia bacterium]
MFGRPVDEDGAPLEIEFLHDAADDVEHDVDLGGGRRGGARSGRRWILAVVGALAVALVALVASSLGREGDNAPIRADSTLAGSSIAWPTTSAPAVSAVTPRRATTTTTISELVRSAPLIPTDQPWSIYLMDQNSGRSMRIDVQTGVAEVVDSTMSFVVSPAGSFVVDMAEGGLGFFPGMLPAGPELGTYWQIGYDQESGGQYVTLRRHQIPRDEELGRIDIGLSEYLLGGTATGDAVIVGPDGDAYAVTLDGTRRRLATGRVSSVQNGYFAEVACTDEGICAQILHGAREVRRVFFGEELVTFSPSGEWAALATQYDVSGEPPVQLLNVINGSVIAPGSGFVPGYFGLGGASLVAFSPDSEWAVGVSHSTLIVIELDTGTVSRYQLPVRGSSTMAVQAIV